MAPSRSAWLFPGGAGAAAAVIWLPARNPFNYAINSVSQQVRARVALRQLFAFTIDASRIHRSASKFSNAASVAVLFVESGVRSRYCPKRCTEVGSFSKDRCWDCFQQTMVRSAVFSCRIEPLPLPPWSRNVDFVEHETSDLHSARRGHNLARISSLVRRAKDVFRDAE